MAAFLRLRQICLVAQDLASEAKRIESIFGLRECHRDANVGRYGLENVLFPVGSCFLEIVAPTRAGTTAGRFLERHGGRYGYMIILDCDDPEARRQHALSLGIRVASVIRHEEYFGVQLHPRDTDAAMVEFNRTDGGEALDGPYHPAGKNWQRAVRGDVTRQLLVAEIECPDPAGLSKRWSALLQRPVRSDDSRIDLDVGSIRFMPTAAEHAALVGIELEVVDRAAILEEADRQRCANQDGTVTVCGVRFRLSV